MGAARPVQAAQGVSGRPYDARGVAQRGELRLPRSACGCACGAGVRAAHCECGLLDGAEALWAMPMAWGRGLRDACGLRLRREACGRGRVGRADSASKWEPCWTSAAELPKPRCAEFSQGDLGGTAYGRVGRILVRLRAARTCPAPLVSGRHGSFSGQCL
ncbi:hypothetical protein Ais01nite_36940 [Asanoa ishikariensis]|nr:hypothetical protein Ais01nite_36940 [Asanoa ishikariensis]